MSRGIFTWIVLLTSLSLAPVVAQNAAERDHQIERLAGLGKLWGDVKFFHPYLAYKAIDWDGAVVRTIPKVKAARTSDEYRTAIDEMLRALDDPETTAEMSSERTRPGARASGGSPPEPTYFRVVDGFVVVNAVDGARALAAAGNPNARPREPEMLAEIARAKGIVFDCRFNAVSPPIPPFVVAFYLDRAIASFVQGTMRLGTERYRLHNGYPPQRGGTSGGYTAGLITDAPGAILGEAKEWKPLAVLIDERTSNLLPALSGLQAIGATIVQTGPSRRSSGGSFRSIALPDGVRVNLRVSEFVHPDGSSGFRPDVRVDNADEDAVAVAIAALSRQNGARATRSSTPPAPMIEQRDASYPQMAFPSEEYRLLALYRFWNVINYFYPYTHLTDKPWATVLTDFIPRFMTNTSALEYDTTVAEMVARMQDSHGSVSGLQDLDAHLGMFAPPLRLASAGGRLAVVDIVDAAPAAAPAFARGDVIVAINGEPVEKRVAALAALRALSTRQAAYAFIYPSTLRGAKDSAISLRVEGPDGGVRTVEATRSVPLSRIAGMMPRTTPPFRVMPNGYGYIDLARLPLADAQKALDTVMNTPAVIFDMRGYPNGTAWALAPRLAAKPRVTAALFRRPLQSGLGFDDARDAPAYTFEQKLPDAQGARYPGKVVMLINEFAISQSEHTCLFFESATDVTFVGSPTNGANGDVTNLVLPGNIYVNFTGHDVRHADGRQLQRVGIQPHITVEMTPKSIADGRDEVLDAAVKHLDGAFRKSR